MACEAPIVSGVPLARWSIAELQREAVGRGLVATVGGTTLWRWLHRDAIRPWRHRSWLFPRDPDFTAKASPILDLYAGRWRGKPLDSRDCVLSADEKTSIQARRRVHPSLSPQPGRPGRVEHEYERLGAWAYLAAWDVRRARVFGPVRGDNRDCPLRPPRRAGHGPTTVSHRSPRVLDHGQRLESSRHPRRRASAAAMAHDHSRVYADNMPVGSTKIEIYFSIGQRKVLNPNDFASLRDLEARLLDFQTRYTLSAEPFRWTLTRRDLSALLVRLQRREHRLAA